MSSLVLQAVTLGQYLVNTPDTVKNKKVLELGSGTGLAGIVAAKIGKCTVYAKAAIKFNQIFQACPIRTFDVGD